MGQPEPPLASDMRQRPRGRYVAVPWLLTELDALATELADRDAPDALAHVRRLIQSLSSE